MKRKLLSASLVIFTVAASSITHADTSANTTKTKQPNYYVGLGFAKTSYKFNDISMGSDTGTALYLGAGYSNPLELRVGIKNYGSFDNNQKISGRTLEGLYKFNIIENGDIYALAGVGTLKFKPSDSAASYQWGVGYRHRIKNFNLQGEFQQTNGIGKTYKELKLTSIGISANYAF